MHFALAFICTLLIITSNDPSIDRPAAIHQKAPAAEAWFFRARSGYPAAISFEPVVLFKNGEYFDVGEEALDMLDVAASKAKRPLAWGKWKKSGNTYYLTDSKNNTTDYQLGTGSWFPAYPYSASVKLKAAYENTSGGDYGNGTNALFKTEIHFLDETHFTHNTNSGITTPNAAGWNKSNSSGTYKIYGHTLELKYNDGKTVKQSFAFGASGSPAKPTNTMIFIGGDAYVDKD